MPEDIHEWVKQRLNEGENPNALKERLSEYGYDPSIIDKLTLPASNTNLENKKENTKKFKINKFVIVGLLLIIIIGFFALSFMNSVSDLWKNENTKDQQVTIMDKIDKGEMRLEELTDYVKKATQTCKELNNYMFFGHHKEECYENILIFYMSQIDELFHKGKLSEEESKKAFEEGCNYALKEICPNFEDKKNRNDCEKYYSSILK